MRSYINLTKVFLKPLNRTLKGFIIRVKYQFENNATKTLGRIRNAEPRLKILLLQKKKKSIAEESKNLFTNVGPNLAKIHLVVS